MNLLEQSVLELIGENTTSPDVFSDTSTGMAQIRDSINDAIEEISMLSGSVQRPYHMLLKPGASFYRMDFSRDRFGWITDAFLVPVKRRLEQTDIYRMDKFNPRWLRNAGSPQAYGQIGKDVFFVWPCPAFELVAELVCVVIPDRYTEDTDRIRVREIYQCATIRYAVGEYYASRGDAAQAIYQHNLYLEALNELGLYHKSNERPMYYRTEKNPQGATS